MNKTSPYPLRFKPMLQYRNWGGVRLNKLLKGPSKTTDLIGEAWLLSDREGVMSVVANGPLKGQTLGDLMKSSPEALLGKLAKRFQHFPLLLKILDAREMLSVQVHPSGTRMDPLTPGETGKCEAWVVLEAGPASRIYAGLKPGTSLNDMKTALFAGKVVDCLEHFTPKAGDAVFLPGGTVHALGGDVLVFEVQQNNDVTYRLFDWDHVDPRTGRTRALQIEQGLASIDFSGAAAGLKVPGLVGTSVDQVIACLDFETYPAGLVVPTLEPSAEALAPPSLTIAESTGGVIAPSVAGEPPVRRERLFQCDHFFTRRSSGRAPFAVGTAGAMRVLVCTEGAGQVEHFAERYAMGKGDVLLLPAAVGACVFRPLDEVQLLEIGVPE